MENNQKAAEIILTLKRTLKFNERKLLQEGTVLPVIISVRNRATRFYRFALIITSVLILFSLVRVVFSQVSFFEVLLPTGFGIFLIYYVRKNYKHIENILIESESIFNQ